MSDSIRIAVLMGGASSEHDVSLASAAAVIGALDPQRYRVMPLLISREGVWSVEGEPATIARGVDGMPYVVSLQDGLRIPIDIVFPVLHGPNGEDGTVQGLLECAGVAYVGAGVAASAISMDKALFKAVLREEGIPTPEFVVVTDAEWYDYETKYQPGRMSLQVPADIPAEAAERARALALQAFRAAECSGLARVDFFLADDGTVLLSELNTMPGFTPTSVYAALMGAGGIAYPDLIDRLVALGFARSEQARRYLG